jgi:hypothetical protein
MGAASSPRSLLLLLGAGLCSCIVSVAGLTGGTGDGGLPEASTDSGESDAGVDVKEGGTDGGSCVPFDPPDGAAVACTPPSEDAGPDAGPDVAPACSPVSLPAFQPTWIPPNPPQNVCTAAQIATVAMCLSSNDPTCMAFVSADAGNQPCIQCMVTAGNSKSYGAIIQDGTLDVLNVGGCIAIVDGCQTPCAYVSSAIDQCHLTACATCLPGGAGLQGFINCTNAADTCSCLPESTANADCAKRLETSVAANCFPTKGFTAGAEYVGKVFCGGGP